MVVFVLRTSYHAHRFRWEWPHRRKRNDIYIVKARKCVRALCIGRIMFALGSSQQTTEIMWIFLKCWARIKLWPKSENIRSKWTRRRYSVNIGDSFFHLCQAGTQPSSIMSNIVTVVFSFRQFHFPRAAIAPTKDLETKVFFSLALRRSENSFHFCSRSRSVAILTKNTFLALETLDKRPCDGLYTIAWILSQTILLNLIYGRAHNR